jgi:hypothetical protein
MALAATIRRNRSITAAIPLCRASYTNNSGRRDPHARASARCDGKRSQRLHFSAVAAEAPSSESTHADKRPPVRGGRRVDRARVGRHCGGDGLGHAARMPRHRARFDLPTQFGDLIRCIIGCRQQHRVCTMYVGARCPRLYGRRTGQRCGRRLKRSPAPKRPMFAMLGAWESSLSHDTTAVVEPVAASAYTLWAPRLCSPSVVPSAPRVRGGLAETTLSSITNIC